MNIWHDIDPSKVTTDRFTAVVEIPKGSNCKYELEKNTGLIKLDRVLHTATHYPENYGFIPRTYAKDKDPLDVLVLCKESLSPLTLVECRPIGVVQMIDDGAVDEKVIAVCIDDPFFSSYKDIKDLPSYVSDEIKHFFRVYKTLEGKKTKVTKVQGHLAAKRVIKACMDLYLEYLKEHPYTRNDN